VTIHVILDIVPGRIDKVAWAVAFEETLRLLQQHPARLLGYGFRVAGGVRVPVFTRGVEQGGNDPSERRWCVVGDRATLGTGERQRMYRDLARYVVRSSAPGAPLAADDILVAATSSPALDVPGVVRVFGEGDQSEPCRLPLLAAAMVVECRFPRYALVSGRFEREHAEVARRWASGVLGRAVALPVRVDAFRLVERLGVAAEGAALLKAVDALFLACPGARERALLGLFERNVAEPWYLDRLRDHASLDLPEARRALAAFLDVAPDLGRLAALACLHPRGPRWATGAFVAAVAALGDPRGASRPRFDERVIDQAVGPVLGAEALRRARAAISAEAALPRARGALAPVPVPAASTDVVAYVSSPGELGAEGRESLRALVCAVREAREREASEGGPVSAGAARLTMARLVARCGPTLTEAAWEWIEREEDPELCAFLAALAAVAPVDAEQAALRRALFENRALCRHAVSVLTTRNAGARPDRQSP
jgi:hypothetical protein